MTVSAVRLHPSDSVICLLRAHRRGECPEFGVELGAPLLADVPLGHKVALAPIPCGSEVRKHGAPIGRATADIAAGEHVHLHNLTGGGP